MHSIVKNITLFSANGGTEVVTLVSGCSDFLSMFTKIDNC